MKRCPTCEKTFDDNLRFCQADGTPLVDAVEEIDPYKTMVAKPGEIYAAIPPEKTEPEPPAPAVPHSSDDVLELPAEQDSNKTQLVTEAEIRAEMEKADAQVVDVPPVSEALPSPEPPKFIEPTPAPPPAASEPLPASPGPESKLEPQAPPASPFSQDLQGDPFQHTTPPIPSPFGERDQPMANVPREPEQPPKPQFADPEPTPPPFIGGEPAPSAPMAQAEWTPPAAPEASWENQELGQDTPFQPPPADALPAGQSKTLAIISLVISLLSIPCCGFIIVGPIGAIVGFVARSKAKSDPANYGGSGLATAAILIGILTMLIGIVTNTLAFLGIIPIPGNIGQF